MLVPGDSWKIEPTSFMWKNAWRDCSIWPGDACDKSDTDVLGGDVCGTRALATSEASMHTHARPVAYRRNLARAFAALGSVDRPLTTTHATVLRIGLLRHFASKVSAFGSGLKIDSYSVAPMLSGNRFVKRRPAAD
jgi:hypothetical protein